MVSMMVVSGETMRGEVVDHDEGARNEVTTVAMRAVVVTVAMMATMLEAMMVAMAVTLAMTMMRLNGDE